MALHAKIQRLKSNSSMWSCFNKNGGLHRQEMTTWRQKTTFCVPPITFQAEPDILPFDLGDCCHMDILRWQRVDSLQFHGLFETVLGLLLAEKEREGKKNHSTHTDGIHFYLYIHSTQLCIGGMFILFEKEVTVSHLLMARHTVDTWKQH